MALWYHFDTVETKTPLSGLPWRRDVSLQYLLFDLPVRCDALLQ